VSLKALLPTLATPSLSARARHPGQGLTSF
jgi:hypothetical protein